MADEYTEYFPISTLTIIPGTVGQFDLFFRREGKYLLYCPKGEGFNREQLAKVLEVTEFYVPNGHKLEYESYLAKNLGDLLQNERVPLKERSKVFYAISSTVMKKALETRLPRQMNPKTHQELLSVVRASLIFMSKEEALRSVSQFIAHTYQTYSHSINVMVLLLAVLQNMPDMDRQLLLDCGMGALLHDIGKTEVPVEILNKPPEDLSDQEWETVKTHPPKGMRICSSLDLSSAAIGCILFHHEKMDGSGYPGGLKGEEIPLEVRALSVCNVYDALTTDRPFAKALAPFEALKVMKEEMPGAFDNRFYKRLVFVLNNARLVK
ncbi:MAG: HD domain-containing protein [Desulfovibrionaceae bacterium]|nr:HD domain-containing protein [Desulfovibrionaceae bacterium]